MIHEDLEKLGEQLTSLSQELKGSSERATRREAQFASATDELLDTQHKLVTQLEVVLDQVQTLKTMMTRPCKNRGRLRRCVESSACSFNRTPNGMRDVRKQRNPDSS